MLDFLSIIFSLIYCILSAQYVNPKIYLQHDHLNHLLHSHCVQAEPGTYSA